VLPAEVTLYLTLAFCALGIGLAVVRYDLYTREPWPLLLLAVAVGAAGMFASYHAEVAVIRAATRNGLTVGYNELAVLAGVVEEIAKVLGVLSIAAIARRHFNDPLDGLVYGSFVGLGAALEESVALLSKSGALATLPATEPVRLVGHLIMGGIGGFGLGVFAARARVRRFAFPGTLLLAIVLHIAWDLAAFDQLQSGPDLTFSQSLIPVLLMLLGMLAYRRLATLGAQLTREFLQICDTARR
jgi:RsiW-degrading membrane proteinase PrsW (M82 family)